MQRTQCRQHVATCKDEVIDTVVFELATGTAVATLPAGIAAHIAFSPDGRTLITTDATALRIWDLATGAQILHHALPATEVDSSGRTFVRRMVVTPDGRQAITAVGDGTALFWNIAAPVHSGRT